MIIKGFAKLTLLDYPGKVACTVFTGGCNFRCPFCHNASLAVRPGEVDSIPDEEVFDLLRKRRGILDGVCITGGEPLMQGEELLRLLQTVDVHVAVETCGYAEEDLFKAVVKRMDYVMFDLKLADDRLHRQYTGVSNRRILQNLRHLRDSGTPYLLRTPLIPGITDTAENLQALAAIVGDDPWQTLEYNPLTPAKYDKLGRPYTLNV